MKCNTLLADKMGIMVSGNCQRHSVALGDIAMNCALDYLQSSAKYFATTCQQHTAVALQAEN
jgi:hypothetical protein